MKIYVNRQPVTGPWGGGNKTLTELCKQITDAGHEVVYNLAYDDIDLIFCFDPRPNNKGEWYQSMLNHKSRHGTPIIQRVGDCGTHGKPELTKLVRDTVVYSDFIIFPSEWARQIIGYSGTNYEIIPNAPLPIFHEFKKTTNDNKKVKLVTHHWSPNPKKGYALYKQLDDYIERNDWLSFTYIGQWPIEPLKNSKYYKPTGDNTFISEKLSECDIYLTASEEEAGANHVLEGMACGLPVIYHNNGGSIPEYCGEYGIGFDNFDQMIDNIKKMSSNYIKHKETVLNYEDQVPKAVARYMEIINEIQSQH